MFVFAFAVSKIMARNEINKIILMMIPFLFLLIVVIINQIIITRYLELFERLK